MESSSPPLCQSTAPLRQSQKLLSPGMLWLFCKQPTISGQQFSVILSTTLPLPEYCFCETVSQTAEPWGVLLILQTANDLRTTVQDKSLQQCRRTERKKRKKEACSSVTRWLHSSDAARAERSYQKVISLMTIHYTYCLSLPLTQNVDTAYCKTRVVRGEGALLKNSVL